MKLLNRLISDPEYDITTDTAEYRDGRLVCPGCGTVDYSLQSQFGSMRRIWCDNCGYYGYLEPGVIIKEVEQDE